MGKVKSKQLFGPCSPSKGLADAHQASEPLPCESAAWLGELWQMLGVANQRAAKRRLGNLLLPKRQRAT